MTTSIIRRLAAGKAAAAALIALAGCLGWSSPVLAQAASCKGEVWNTWTPWSVKPLTEGVTAGMVLAEANATILTQMINSSPNGEPVKSSGAWFVGFDNTTRLVPLRDVPGVGVRLKWLGVTSPSGFKSLTTAPAGTVIEQHTVTLEGVLNPIPDAEYTESYVMELVVTDPALYVGGAVTAESTGMLNMWTGRQGENPVGCAFYVGPLPPSPLQSIVLPRPPAPGCEFDTATLNQTVPLSPAGSSSVARSNAARSAGTAGEKTFTIEARNCAAGATFNLYFTDALAEGSAQDYLRQANGSNVGIRLYHANTATPVQFGPAPVGSTLPARAPITVGGPSAEKGASHTLPFTAQYVQLPDAAGPPTVGEVGAKAKVTVVYP